MILSNRSNIHRTKPRAIFISTQFPQPPHSGGRLVTLEHLKYLVSHFDLDVICKSEEFISTKDLQDFKEIYRLHDLVVYPHWIKTNENKLEALKTYLRTIILFRPFKIEKHSNSKLKREIRKRISQNKYTFIFFDQLPSVSAGIINRVQKEKVVLFTHNVEWETVATQIPLHRNVFVILALKWEGLLLKRYEHKVLRKIGNVAFLSEEDRSFFPDLKNSITLRSFSAIFQKAEVHPKQTGKPKIFLVASWSWNLNRQGLTWFLEEVTKYLSTKIEICIAGAGIDDTFRKKYAPLRHVKFLGYVQEIEPYYSQGTVVAIPLFGGSGIKIKALEAMSYGIPMVVTPDVIKGLNDYKKAFVVSDSPQMFAQHLHELIQNKQYWAQQHDLVQNEFLRVSNNPWESELEDYLHTLQP